MHWTAEPHWSWWCRHVVTQRTASQAKPSAPVVVKVGTPAHQEIVAMESRLKARQADMRLWGTGIVVKRGEG